MEEKNLSIVMDKEDIKKLDYIARYYCRTRRKQLIHLIEEYVEEFETEHGEIKLED